MAKQFTLSCVLNPSYDKLLWEEELNLNKEDKKTASSLEVGESFIGHDPFIRIERTHND